MSITGHIHFLKNKICTISHLCLINTVTPPLYHMQLEIVCLVCILTGSTYSKKILLLKLAFDNAGNVTTIVHKVNEILLLIYYSSYSAYIDKN